MSQQNIYLFGSYAYGKPTEESDLDVYIVTPDDIDNFSEINTKIMIDLSYKKIFFIDLLLNTESTSIITSVNTIGYFPPRLMIHCHISLQ